MKIYKLKQDRDELVKIKPLLDEAKAENLEVEVYLVNFWYYAEYYMGEDYDIFYNRHGFILGERNGDYYTLLMLFVTKLARRNGVALALKNRLTRHAKEIGCKCIDSTIREDNVGSMRLNKKAGWKRHRAWIQFTKDLGD